MARSRLVDPINDLITDGGSILWSFVQGEQLEFPVTLGFVENILITSNILTNPTYGYSVEAKVIEANNVADQTTKPTAIKTGGVVTPITIRIPYYAGTWSAGTYAREDVVLHNGVYYKSLLNGAGTADPAADTARWAVTQANRIYIQYPKTLGNDWSTKQYLNTNTNIYGFFELRVTEPSAAGTYSNGTAAFVRTWKPIRGMVEILYSPTFSTDD